ncbi:MAG: hypothetical protein WBQ59_17565 [Candidatus Acidiferrum sp.]
MQQELSDLDELVIRCRGDAARTYIREAVACYKGGAYRSAVVATWIAILYDFLDKLRELEMSGDAAAKVKLQEFETARANNNWKASLQFESTLLESAQKQFELLSPLEVIDLNRLSEDRNRCAHPSMSSSSEPYRATAELARSHIKNAVSYLLEHPPVQGKAAFDRIMKDIQSEYFPRDTDRAIEFFRAGPLTRARQPLVRNLVIALSKTVLGQVLKTAERARMFAALNAIAEMYRQQTEGVLRELLPQLAAAQPDKRFYRLIFYVARVNGTWEFLGSAGQIKTANYIEKADNKNAFRFLPYALQLPALKPLAKKRLADASTETLARVINFSKSAEYAEFSVPLFEKAGSFRKAEALFEELILPQAEFLDGSYGKRILGAFCENGQITYASRIPGLYLEFLKNTSRLDDELKPSWKQVFNLIETEKRNITSAEGLCAALKKRFGFKAQG